MSILIYSIGIISLLVSFGFVTILHTLCFDDIYDDNV